MSATIGAALATAAAALTAAGFDEPRRRARRLVAAALDLSEAAVFGYPERALPAAEELRLKAMLGRMAAREPLSRILGRRAFWGLDFVLSAATLDPRPESEGLVEAVLARLPDRARPYRFLDLGTGSGCLLLALLCEYAEASGVGVDIAPDAVRTARDNARRLGLADRAAFAADDWGQAVAGRFDAVVANPPYIPTPALGGLPPEVRDHDPRRALDGGTDGLASYRALAAALPRLLRPGGMFAVEIGAGQAESVAAIVARHGLGVAEVRPDLAGIARCLVGHGPSGV
jgi:release factor glutamine methyltransferase